MPCVAFQLVDPSRLRAALMRQMAAEVSNLGSLKSAIQHGVSSHGYWHMARTPVTQQAMSNAWLKAQG